MAHDETAGRVASSPAAGLTPDEKSNRAADERAAALIAGDDEGGAGFSRQSR
jgi:hypothetical protein